MPHKVDLATRQKGSFIAFRNIWLGHISVVCSVFLMTLMKRWNYFTIAQICQLVVVSSYIMTVLLTTWTVKLYNHVWIKDNNMNMMDVWILLETIFFFSQIMAGMGFLA